ncbi:MAG: hypothetical protein ACRDA0_03275 [Cetobacterium sp.]|uniref:hypothetical protein n=1 Tax=Cetobacterium sp. TaxID=2071632 RepID=UPI003F3A4361
MFSEYDYIKIKNITSDEKFIFNLSYLKCNKGIYEGKYIDLVEKLKQGSRKNILKTKSWNEYKCYMISKHSLLKCNGKNRIFETLQYFKKDNE